MPLLDLTPSTYIERSREYVDSDEREEDSASEFDIVHRLSKRYQYVQSIEVTDFNFPTNISPTFIARQGVIPGNNLLDVRMESQVGPDVLEFTVILEAGRYFTTVSELGTYIIDQLNATMDAQGDPFFSTTAATPVIWVLGNTSVTNEDTLAFDVERGASVLGEVYSYFLFGTGQNKRDAPARVIGFDEGRDTVVLGVFPPIPGLSPFGQLLPRYGPTAPFIPQLLPFRYIDVFVQELEPSIGRRIPVARIFLYTDQNLSIRYTHSHMTTARPRLFTQPLKRVDTLAITLRLEGDREPPQGRTSGWDLQFDILTLTPEQSIPVWTKQFLKYP